MALMQPSSCVHSVSQLSPPPLPLLLASEWAPCRPFLHDRERRSFFCPPPSSISWVVHLCHLCWYEIEAVGISSSEKGWVGCRNIHKKSIKKLTSSSSWWSGSWTCNALQCSSHGHAVLGAHPMQDACGYLEEACSFLRKIVLIHLPRRKIDAAAIITRDGVVMILGCCLLISGAAACAAAKRRREGRSVAGRCSAAAGRTIIVLDRECGFDDGDCGSHFFLRWRLDFVRNL